MNQPNNIINYLYYLKIIYSRRYVFLAVAMLVTSLIIAFAYQMPKKYRADSIVFIEKNVISNLVKGLAVSPDMRDRIRVLRYALSSRELIMRVLTEMDSDIFLKSKAEQQKFIKKLKNRTGIEVHGEKLFKVSLVDEDPAFAQTYVNTLVGKYVEENTSAKREETYGANRFLKEQINLFKKKLDTAEEAIIKFRNKNGIYFSLDEKTTLADIKKYKMEIEDIELQLDTYEPRRKALQNQLKLLSPTIEAGGMFEMFDNEGGGDPRLAEKEALLERLLIRYTENHPAVVVLKAEIKELKKRSLENESDLNSSENEANEETLSGYGSEKKGSSNNMMSMPNPVYQQVKQEIISIRAETATLNAKKMSLQRLIRKREETLREIPENRKELGVLIQERNSVKQVYQELLRRMSQSEVSKQMEIGNKSATFRIVDPALFPETPVSPNIPVMIFFAIIAGLGCGLGVIVLPDIIASPTKNPNQLEAMGVKVLACIPHIDDGITSVRSHKTDVLMYTFSSLYYAVVVAILTSELLHLEIIKYLKGLIS